MPWVLPTDGPADKRTEWGKMCLFICFALYVYGSGSIRTKDLGMTFQPFDPVNIRALVGQVAEFTAGSQGSSGSDSRLLIIDNITSPVINLSRSVNPIYLVINGT